MFTSAWNRAMRLFRFASVVCLVALSGCASEQPTRCGSTQQNECGGCSALTASPGDACGECEDGRYACNAAGTLSCGGATLSRNPYWPDQDGDGFGAIVGSAIYSCSGAGENFVSNNSDCDDGEATVYPGATEICDGLDQNCDGFADEAPDDCNDTCCDDLLTCEGGQCELICETGITCGAGSELCCNSDEVCYADVCVVPSGACEFTEDCAEDELCDRVLELCLPRAGIPVCTYEPPIGQFQPSLECRWTAEQSGEFLSHQDVVGTPIVINLTDDNRDGETDQLDIPDIAFLTYDYSGDGCCNVSATLRIVDGLCKSDGSMITLASINEPGLNNDTGIAAGDLNGDGVPEIVAIGRSSASGNRPQGTIAFERVTQTGTEWRVLWENPDYPTWNVHTRGGALISLANLDGQESPEVIIGNVVLNGDDGTLKWDGNETSEGTGGIGNNAFLGPSSTAADLDWDGLMEVVAGNTLYNHRGDVQWTYEYDTNNSNCGGQLPCDGFSAVGDFDEDPDGEIVIVRLGEVFVLNMDMSLVWQASILKDDCSFNESGPPTVADFDGDGFPEIATAAADFYVVLDMNTCGGADWEANGCAAQDILWAVPNQDCTSRVTGSSVFDFEGDGRAEVVYADETSFRIFDGLSGYILFEDTTHGSHTRIEMPVIADVDNDGNAEIVIPENRWGDGTAGLEVWSDASDNWVRTRRIWNQHGYHITNIEEDGTIPLREERNWSNERLNNYRQNVQPAGLFDAPDLTVEAIDATGGFCPVTTLDATITIANRGALDVPAGVIVEVWVSEPRLLVTIFPTEERLFPGQTLNLDVELSLPEGTPSESFELVAIIDPDGAVNECIESNNSVLQEVTCNISE